MIIDTHCHLDFPEFDFDRDSVVEKAKASGVECIINVGSSLEGSKRSIELAKEYEIVFASVGIHPHYADKIDEKVIDQIQKLIKSDKVVAVGEVGLDYYRNLSSKSDQKKRFKDFLNIALENNLPVIIHSREAGRDTLDVLKEVYKNNVNGIMHCFSLDENYLEECIKMGLYISFTCNLTFKNAKHLREVAKKVPPEKLLLETDAPFLAPQQFRGKRNEPSYLVHLVQIWAELLKLSEQDIERITTQNAKRLFKLSV